VKLREFRYYVETEPGLIIRRETKAYYEREMRTMAGEMVGHYNRVWGRPELAALRSKKFAEVLAIGGGHPGLESRMNTSRIRVLDPMAEMYESCVDVFLAHNPGAPKVVFEAGVFEGPKTIGKATCVTMCHMLEHMPMEKAEEQLAYLGKSRADIVIYGPNADCMQSDGWLHAMPVHEHLWMGGLEWTTEWAQKQTGREARFAIAHDHDLCIWLPAPRGKAKKGK